jgi:hypothetical protein
MQNAHLHTMGQQIRLGHRVNAPSVVWITRIGWSASTRAPASTNAECVPFEGNVSSARETPGVGCDAAGCGNFHIGVAHFALALSLGSA